MHVCAILFCCVVCAILAACILCAWEGVALYGAAAPEHESSDVEAGDVVEMEEAAGAQDADPDESLPGEGAPETGDLTTANLADGLPLPKGVLYDGKPDSFVDSVYARNEERGAALQQDLTGKEELPLGELGRIAQQVEEQSAAAAAPLPPRFEPISLDVLPQKYWQPVFSGCQPVFTDARCDVSYPMPRLFVTDLDELRYARQMDLGRVNVIEPQRARQAMQQLLSIGVRSRKDVYTQASSANDIPSQSVCAQLKNQSPAYVWR